jgi:hypothetical protein
MIHVRKKHEFSKKTKTKTIKPRNNYKILNDKIWTLFIKILLSFIFCWIDFFSFKMYAK